MFFSIISKFSLNIKYPGFICEYQHIVFSYQWSVVNIKFLKKWIYWWLTFISSFESHFSHSSFQFNTVFRGQTTKQLFNFVLFEFTKRVWTNVINCKKVTKLIFRNRLKVSLAYVKWQNNLKLWKMTLVISKEIR